MIRIRCGDSWRHDPETLSALRRARGRARAAASRAVVDALALEVDGIDIAAGRAEGPLLPSLEALLRAIARVVGGASHATVALPDGELEIVIRRRGASALLTVVAVSRPSQLLARDVEVDVEELAAAALEASADLCRELSEVLPDRAAREARRLRAAARDLRRTEAAPPRGSRAPGRVREPRAATRKGRLALVLEIADDEGLLVAYEGGRPDLGSLLVPGRLSLRAADGREISLLPGIPFLALRDLGSATDRLLAAVLRGDPRHEIPLSRAGRGAPASLVLDLADGRLLAPPGAPSWACPPLELARSFCEAAIELCRVARARNPRQAENGYLVALEAGAADRLAQVEEIAQGDLSPPSPGEPASSGPPRAPQRALGPGRLRRLAFRRAWELDVGRPAGDGLLVAGGILVVAGATAVAAVDRSRDGAGAIWRQEGVRFAATLPGAILLASDGAISAHAPRTGRTLWRRPLPGASPSSAAALPRGPYVLAEAGALTALDVLSGRTLWRFEPPGATRVGIAASNGVVVAAADTGALYGVDAGGRVVWRIRARGPFLRAPSVARGVCLAIATVDPGASLLAVEPASGTRLWEAPLDFVPSSPAVAWGRRFAVAGPVAGDAVVSVVDRAGAPVWTAAPPLLVGQTSLAPGSSLHVRDARGALVALGHDGEVRWSLAPRPGHATAGTASPALARGTLIAAAGDGLSALDARTGEILGVIPGTSPSRLAVDGALCVVALDEEGTAAGWRLATHLSVL